MDSRLEKQELLRLYEVERLSMAEIATRFACSVNKVVYWMTRHGIARRTMSEATYVKRNPVEPFEVKPPLTPAEERLKALALGLYLGEGHRRSRFVVALTNSDARTMRLFVRFLREVCRVAEPRMRVGLIVHPDVPRKKAEEFWSAALGIGLEQFQKTHVLNPRGAGTYRSRCEHGVATVAVGSTTLRKQIQDWIDELPT